MTRSLYPSLLRSHKRHPRRCKKNSSETGCNFGNDCAYHHGTDQATNQATETNAKIDRLEKIVIEMTSKMLTNKDITSNKEETENYITTDNELNEKVKMLEAVVQKMFINIVKLEAEVGDLKSKCKTKDITDKTALWIFEAKWKEQQENAEKETATAKCPLQDQQDMVKDNDELKCDMCSYRCKKKNILVKHMNTKHNDQKCKICNKEFPNSMEALIHKAKDHSKNIIKDIKKSDIEENFDTMTAEHGDN